MNARTHITRPHRALLVTVGLVAISLGIPTAGASLPGAVSTTMVPAVGPPGAPATVNVSAIGDGNVVSAEYIEASRACPPAPTSSPSPQSLITAFDMPGTARSVVRAVYLPNAVGDYRLCAWASAANGTLPISSGESTFTVVPPIRPVGISGLRVARSGSRVTISGIPTRDGILEVAVRAADRRSAARPTTRKVVGQAGLRVTIPAPRNSRATVHLTLRAADGAFSWRGRR